MPIKVSVSNPATVDLVWRDTTFQGSAGRIKPSAINYLEMAVGTCIGRGITKYFLDKNFTQIDFPEHSKLFGEIAVEIAENDEKVEADDTDWVVRIVCTTQNKECADALTEICDSCTILTMLQADVTLNFVSNPYPETEVIKTEVDEGKDLP